MVSAYVADRASFYYFFTVFVVIRYKTKATARRALTFIVRIFVNDTIAIAVWTSFHAIAVWRSFHVCLRIWSRVRDRRFSMFSAWDRVLLQNQPMSLAKMEHANVTGKDGP